MRKDEALAAFAGRLHADLVTGLSMDDLAREQLGYLSGEQREALRVWLATALATLTPSEMKGILNRANDEIRFSSKGAYALLRAAADQLDMK